VSAASIFRELALKRLRKRLRTDQAISYAPSIAYWPLGANLAHLAIYADSHGEHREDLAKVFGEAFEELGDFDEFEIAEARDQVLEGWTGTLAPPEADRILGDLQRAAMDWVLEKEYESLETIADGVSAVTRDDLSAYHGELVGTAMFALPSVARLRDSFGERAPISSVPIVNGEIIASADAPIDKTQLVSGPSGVSVLYSNGSDITVRYEYLAAVIDFTDGCVCLIGEDATWLAVEPTLWRGGHRVCRQIRERSPDHLVVEERTRSRDEIPRPNTTGWQRFLARLTLR
jgi:hypothetical protein